MSTDAQGDWLGRMADEQPEEQVTLPDEDRAGALRLLGSLLRPYRHVVWLLAAAVVVENIARLALPWLVHRGIDRGIPAMVDQHSTTQLVTTVALMLLALAVQSSTRVWFLRRSGEIGQDILLELRRRVFRHFQSLDVAFHDRYTSGRVVSRQTSDMDAIQEMLAGGFDGLITSVLTMVGTSIMLFVLDWQLALVPLVSMALLVLLLRWFSVQSTKAYGAVRERSAQVIVHFVESMTGIRAVQAYRREPRNQEIFATLAHRQRQANKMVFWLFAVFMPGIKLVGNVTIALILVLGGLKVLHGQMTLGVLTAFLLYVRSFFDPMQEIGQFYNSLQSALSALTKLSGVLGQPSAVAEPEHPTPLPQPRGAITFDDVQFSYATGRVVMPGLDLHIPAGQTVALVGTTGAGKTTIAKLVARFYDPTGGTLRIDGIDARQLSDEDLRRAVVLVTQENFLFSGSIASNIRFGRPDASDDQVRAAARAVGADTFISQLPDGYDTSVEKGGERLSAGQRQLVAFARAFLADPAVLILDEATSSLDIPSERLVQRALQTLLADRTAIIIAHRLSTVEIADRVLVLEHGRVLEDGSPAQLAQQTDGHYASLHDAWVNSLA